MHIERIFMLLIEVYQAHHNAQLLNAFDSVSSTIMINPSSTANPTTTNNNTIMSSTVTAGNISSNSVISITRNVTNNILSLLQWDITCCQRIQATLETLLLDKYGQSCSLIWCFYSQFYAIFRPFLISKNSASNTNINDNNEYVEQQQLEFGRKLFFRALQNCTIHQSVILLAFGSLLESFHHKNSSSMHVLQTRTKTKINGNNNSDGNDDDSEEYDDDKSKLITRNRELDEILKIIENREICFRWSVE